MEDDSWIKNPLQSWRAVLRPLVGGGKDLVLYDRELGDKLTRKENKYLMF